MNKEPSSPPLPKPQLILRLGGLGNRKFGKENGIDEESCVIEAAAVAACHDVFKEIEAILIGILDEEKPENRLHNWPEPPPLWKTHGLALIFGKKDRWERESRCGLPAGVFSEESPKVTVLTGDEIGGDCIIREAALCRGDSSSPIVSYDHLRIVPKAPTTVTDGLGVGGNPDPDKALKAKVERNELLTRAEAAKIAYIARKRSLGFRAQSKALRHHSDILLAIWDPDAEGKAGGTSESVAAALHERIPVIAIRILGSGQVAVHLLESIENLQSLQGGSPSTAPSDDWKPVLKKVLRSILQFPDPQIHSPKSQHQTPPSSYHPRAAYAVFISGTPLQPIWVGKLWRNFNDFLSARAFGADLKVKQKENQRFPEALPAPGNFAYHFGQAKKRAASGGISGVYGDAHRGAIIASYLFASIAVLLALVGAFLHFADFPEHLKHYIHLAGIIIAVMETGAILILYALAVCSQVEDWNLAYTDSRILAEALRLMEFLGPLGVHTPLPRLPYYLRNHSTHASPEASWAVWYFRALVRMAPLRLTGPVDSSDLTALGLEFKDRLIKSQIEYHLKNLAKQKKLHKDIENLSRGLFALVGTAAVLHALELILHLNIHAISWACLIICVGGPALISGLHGFASQIENARLLKNSEAMVDILQEQARNLDTLDLATPTEATAVWGLTTEALETAGIMMEETANWSKLYEADIHAG